MGIDVYAMVTDRILSTMGKGIIPWKKPWKGGDARFAISHVTGKRYSLLNQLYLGLRPGEYLTFKQIQKENGRVRKGEKSSIVVYWNFIKATQTDKETGEEVAKMIPMLKYYNVFHVDQCEGIKPRYTGSQETMTVAELNAEADEIINDYVKRSGVTFEQKLSMEAYYNRTQDKVVVPEIEQFSETAEYYSTAFHELTHSTGHKSRLDRLDENSRFGNEVYSKEELVAELGASALVNFCGLETESSFRNNAAYIQGWSKALQEDKKMIVWAAGKADKAVRLILGDRAEEEKEGE